MLAPLLLLLYLMPVKAIGGSDIKLSGQSAGGPDIEISGDNNRLAVVYYKQSNTGGSGAIFVKSATLADGWVTSNFVGLGSNPQLAFKRNANNVVYVVWATGDGTAIQAARCTLNATSAPSCGPRLNVRSLTVGNLSAPDIVVDSGNVLHVAWQNGDNIETARSTAADSVNGWSGVSSPGFCTGNRKSGPVLGYTAASSKLHLAYLCGAAASTPTSVQYRRSNTGSHNWTDAQDEFVKGIDINDLQSKLGNVALHANGLQVSLTWDGLRTDGVQQFGLMYVASTSQGTSWGTVSYVPSGNAATGGLASERKLSTTSSVPPQEYGLRPSLVISPTNSGNAAVVWQQKLNNGSCQDADNGSSDIHYANPQNSAASLDTLQHGKSAYSIDPDLAVGTGGVRHFVFMKDSPASNCTGGNAPDYAIFYRGPFEKVDHDQGETGGGIYLPIIRK
jgi:hypothetical protein